MNKDEYIRWRSKVYSAEDMEYIIDDAICGQTENHTQSMHHHFKPVPVTKKNPHHPGGEQHFFSPWRVVGWYICSRREWYS